MDKVKRERNSNFSLQERDSLVALVEKYKSVLENKKSDASTWRDKESAWEKIEQEFNAISGGVFRSRKALKIKYEGLKRCVRKKTARIRSELYRTGGGSNIAPPLDRVEEQIKTMITLSAEGLESIYDADVLPQEGQSEINVNNIEDLIFVEPSLENKCVFKENKTPLLSMPTDAEVEEIQESVNTTTNNHDEKDLNCTPTRTSAVKKWDVSSRRNLKSRKHPALTAHPTQKKPYDDLVEAKLEVVNLQKRILEEEIIEKKRSGNSRRKSVNGGKKSVNGEKKTVNGEKSVNGEKKNTN